MCKKRLTSDMMFENAPQIPPNRSVTKIPAHKRCRRKSYFSNRKIQFSFCFLLLFFQEKKTSIKDVDENRIFLTEKYNFRIHSHRRNILLKYTKVVCEQLTTSGVDS